MARVIATTMGTVAMTRPNTTNGSVSTICVSLFPPCPR